MLREKPTARLGAPNISRLPIFQSDLDVATFLGDAKGKDRLVGQDIRDAILEALYNLPSGSVLVVDLRGIRQASYFALHEMFAVLPALSSAPTLAEKYLLFRVE